MAEVLIKTRTSGYSVTGFLRQNIKAYAVMLLVFSVSGAFFWSIGAKDTIGTLALAAAIIIIRDIGWVRRIKATWPFSVKVTDWDKVQAIAEGRELPPRLPE